MKSIPYLLGLSLCGASAGLAYIWLRSKESDNIDTTIKPKKTKTHSQLAKVEFIIQNEMVPVVVGRTGANLQTIESKTSTMITFRENDDASQICEITGTQENVLKAEVLVREEASPMTIITEEIYIPQSAFAKLSSKACKAIREISRRSVAEVTVGAMKDDQSTDMRCVKIKGSRANVKIAKSLIEEKMRSDAKE